MQRFLPKFWILFLSVGLGAAWTILVWIETLQMRTPGLRRLGLVAVFFVLVSLLAYWLSQRSRAFLRRLTVGQRSAVFGLAGIFAALLLVMLPVPFDKFFYLFAPTHRLTLAAETGSLAQVEILQFNTAAGPLDPLRSFETRAEKLTWQGKVGSQAVLAFKPVESPLRLVVAWDEQSQVVELSQASDRKVIFVSQGFALPWFQPLAWLFSVWLALASLVFGAALLAIWPVFRPVVGRLPWPWYALPMFLVWLVYLLTYWPGLLSPDSIMQWGEVQSGAWSDAHPAIHTLLIWLLSRLWNTPAVLVLFHIFLLSLLTAWGLGELQKLGVNPLALWLGAGLFAFFPLNGLLVISVWKDITYACALFAIFLQFVKIYFSGGAWLKNNWNLAGLLLAGLTTALVRHNGFPVVLACLLVLLWLYRQAWRQILVSTVLFLALWAGIRGPLYSLLGVKLYPGFANILYLDHIDAHLHAGTKLLPAEKAFLETLLPLADWPYNCADSDLRKMDGPIPFDYFTQNPPEPRQIAMNLFFRNPRVDLEHTLCSGALVWKINTGHYLSLVSMGQAPDGSYGWVVKNDLGVVEKSVFPALVPVLFNPLTEKDLLAKPAFYLLLSLFLLVSLSIRLRSPRFLVLAAPLICQSGVMFFVTYAQDFRYLYSTVLMAFFSLVLWFLPVSTPEPLPRKIE